MTPHNLNRTPDEEPASRRPLQKTCLVLLTGGIGAGKSVVAKVLASMGYRVYDSDTQAKKIMDGSEDIKQRIAELVCKDAVTADGRIDRTRLAACVFKDANKLALLNGIVHTAVIDDIARELNKKQPCGILFVETAIARESGLDRIADRIWVVDAPLQLRITRVCQRSALTPAQVNDRIKAQQPFMPAGCTVIENDGRQALLPQINAALTALEKHPGQ